MGDPWPAPKPASTVFVFGPQALSFGRGFLARLHSQLQEPDNQWLLQSASELPGFWKPLSKDVPTLQHLDGQTLLADLLIALRDGELDNLQFPLPNILLSPVVVLSQFVQYFAFLKVALPHLAETDVLPSFLLEKTEVLGLCTGMLTAMAVNCSSSLAQLKHHGGNAIRLAMITGALVDAEQVSPNSEGKATSFSVSWGSPATRANLDRILGEHPDVYESVSVDEKRSTITTNQQTASDLAEKLRSVGLHVIDVALSGRFHWVNHQSDTEKLIQFCNKNPIFHWPQLSDLALSHRARGKFAPTDRLHVIALDLILAKKSQWQKIFSLAYTSHTTEDAKVICFGQERCIPPTIAQKLGSRLIHTAQIDLSTSPIPRLLRYNDTSGDQIAVIGMSCHVPGASDLSEFWSVLASGQSQHTEVPSSRFNMETPWRDVEKGRKWFGNFINNHDTFDHKFFKKSPREMASTDPQHRIILQLAYQAVEQSGYFAAPDESIDKHVGCYIGMGNVEYARQIDCHPANAYTATGNLRSFVAGKVSHYFGWTGPSLSIDTACSSSSVAIDNACRSILHGECATALAGGVNILTSPEWFHNMAGSGFLSHTGQCKPFDAKGDGYCRGEGAGLVFLKKLSSALADGDQVLGVIASSRVYQNQNCTAITVPNAASLSKLFVDVVRQAKLEPQDISVVEAHGTGTPVGDPAEYDAIRQVLGGPGRSNKLSLSSIKGSVGHSEFASGVISLLKILLMIDRKAIPPQASFSTLSPGIKAGPADEIEIPLQLGTWDTDFRAALINNYGASGSNASMVVTEAPKVGVRTPSPLLTPGKSFPFWFCGLNDQSIRNYISKFRKYVQIATKSGKDLSVANLSFQVSRQSNRNLPQALILSANSLEQLERKLVAYEKNEDTKSSRQQPPARPVILCFGGQISTYIGLDKDLYNQVAILKDYLDKCNTACLSLGLDSIYPYIFQRSPIEDIVRLQTALFALQYSCAKTWIDCGVKVAALVGHSFGELTALCVAGVYSLYDALKLISGRARLIREYWGTDKGSMLAVEADLGDINALLEMSNQAAEGLGDVSIACYNGPRTFTLAGPTKAVQVTENLAKNQPRFANIRMKKLQITNAFHSTLVEVLMNDLISVGEDITFKEAAIRVERATEQPCTGILGPGYAAEHMREPVFFHHAVQRLAKDFASAIWLEAGSNSTVTTMASRAMGNPSSSYFQHVNITSDNSFQLFVDMSIKLWKEGLNVSFWPHHAQQTSEYTPLLLPPYQFEKSRHWMEIVPPLSMESQVVEKTVQADVPQGLTIFTGYQDTEQRRAKFRVNQAHDKFIQLFQANIVANVCAMVPGMLQLSIAIDALKSLRPDFSDLGFQPELSGMSHDKLLIPENTKEMNLDVVATDEASLVWEWKISAADKLGATSDYTTGTIIFRPTSHPKQKDHYQSLSRLSGRKRCIALLEGVSADEVLTGRNIYRAFTQVTNYKDPYRRVTKIAASEYESAGRVTKAYEGGAWVDPILTECFCQVAGIYVNIMTDTSKQAEDDVFLCEGIDRWIRNPELHASSALPEVWEVFAVHQQESETKYVSDVFAFDPRDGSLVEAVLGISYQRVSIDEIRNAVSQPVKSKADLTNGSIVASSAQVHSSKPSIATAPMSAPLEKQYETKRTNLRSNGPDVAGKTREMLCNLSGLEPGEIKMNSDLIELGIDSLMAMELVREVEQLFKCTLETDHLMTLTDFRSFVDLIRSTLGLEPDNSPSEDEEELWNPTNGNNGVITSNGTNGINGTDGYLTPPEEASLPALVVRQTFEEVKKATDGYIVKGQLGGYTSKVLPRSTELCVLYIVNAFEELGCPIRSTAAGQQLERIPFLPKHEQFVELIYDLLEHQARLITRNGSIITRTAVAVPSKSAEVSLAELLRDEPVHAAEHKLVALIGFKFADCLIGKEDCLQIVFGTAYGREILTDMYTNSPITAACSQQLEDFLKQLVEKLPEDGQPIRILEMGAGTAGTTTRLVPMLESLGVPVTYTFTDLSASLVAAARKKFKPYPFVKFEVVNIESPPAASLLQSQHIILASNAVHATRDLSVSLRNIHQTLRSDGVLLLVEMTERMPWVDFSFGLVDGWWLFEDDRDYAIIPVATWEKMLRSAGFGHVDWTEGQLPEVGLQRFIIAHASGPKNEGGATDTLPAPARELSAELSQRQAVVDGYIEKYTKDFRAPSRPSGTSSSLSSSKRRVLVTGATGSLGGHIVAYLAQLPQVETVVCLNRLSTQESGERQRKSLEMRGIWLDPSTMAKLYVVETDTSKPMLGLSEDSYRELIHSVTEIVHSAWPMSLTRPVRAFEAQFKVFRNLVDFARVAAEERPAGFKFGFQFISSLAVVANYPELTGNAVVPETSTTIETVPATGYADAKLTCEHILRKTLYAHPDRFHAMVVRTAQISGSTSNGYWNPTEYMPFLIRTSQTLKMLPDLSGTLSWYPVNGVAATLGELLMCSDASDLTYHIDNPSRQPWKGMIESLAYALNIPSANIIPYEEWVNEMRTFGGSIKDNPALQLAEYFEHYFEPMSCGGLMLDTTNTIKLSSTMQTMGPIGTDQVVKYVAAWKQSGFLNH